MITNGIVYYKRIHDVLPFVHDNYIITSNGEVYSDSVIFHQNETPLSVKQHHKGYIQVRLMTDNGMKQFMIHRLVAFAFIYNEDPINKNQVNHKDGNKTNNCIENLEWVTPSENMSHAVETGLLVPLYGETHSQAKLCNEQARFICEKLDVGTEYREIANQLSLLPYPVPDNIIELINKIHHRKNWTWMSKDYKFEIPIDNVKLTLNDEQVHQVCRMMEDGIYNYKIIVQNLGYNLNDLDKKQLTRFRRCIADIRNGIRSVQISSQYNFKNFK